MSRPPFVGLAAAALLVALAAGGPARALTIEEIGADGGPGEDGAPATATGVETVPTADPVEVEVTARGGRGGDGADGLFPAGDGGAATLGPVFGASQGGDVSVQGTVFGGAGGGGDGSASAGDGASAQLWNAVDGETSGHLELSQTAIGGDAGGGIGGAAGSARSVLRRHASGASLRVSSFAGAGQPGGGSNGASGAGADAEGMADNDAGAASTVVSAFAGAGAPRSEDTAAQPGGDASVVAGAHTRGGGHAVTVGALPFEFCVDDDRGRPSYGRRHFIWRVLDGAIAGAGGGALPGTGVLPAGPGGAAHSQSLGLASGDSPVEVYDVAFGGDGQQNAGGAASSLAMGTARGSSPVRSESIASGGRSRSFVGGAAGAPGGSADARAWAIGQAEVHARAYAIAGEGSLGSAAPGAPNASAEGEASATALGRSGDASASAAAEGTNVRIDVRSAAGVAQAATAAAHVGPAQAGAGWLPPGDASAAWTLLPGAGGASAATGGEVVEARGSLRARQTQRPPSGAVATRFEIQIERSLPVGIPFLPGNNQINPAIPPPPPSLVVGAAVSFASPHITRRGFESLHVLLTREAVVLLDETFDDAGAAEEFLAENVFASGPLGFTSDPPPPPRLPPDACARPEIATLTLELVTSAPGTAMTLGFEVTSSAVLVP